MKKLFTHNLPWKIVSLLLATILWLFVINSQNPTQPQKIENIPVEVRGLSELSGKGFVIQNEDQLKNQTLKVVVEGPRLETEKIVKDPALIDVKLDLTNIINNVNIESEPVTKLAIYEIKIRDGIKGVSIIDYSPKTFSVVFEKEESVSKKVEIAFIGDAPSEYTALEPIIKPSNIDIWGGSSSIDKIARVVVDVNYDNFSENSISYTAPVRILDDKGNEITNLKKSPQFVEVTLPIGKKKTVVVEPTFTGKSPEGYFHTNTIVNPKELTIVGKPEVIDTINSIKLQPIVLDNLIQTSTLKVDFKLPEGVKYIDIIDNKATVIVEIKKQDSFTYSIPIEDIDIEAVGLSEGLTYELATQQISLELRATAEELLSFDKKNIKGKVDLSSLSEGNYEAVLELDIPDNYTIVNQPILVNIKVLSAEQVTTQALTEEAFMPSE